MDAKCTQCTHEATEWAHGGRLSADPGRARVRSPSAFPEQADAPLYRTNQRQRGIRSSGKLIKIVGYAQGWQGSLVAQPLLGAQNQEAHVIGELLARELSQVALERS